MTEKERNDILERTLKRERAARKVAERLLEEKSKELYQLSEEQRKSNEKLQELLLERTSELEGVFLNINDAYIVIDLSGNVLKMNKAANTLLGHNISNGPLNLLSLVDKKYRKYTLGAFKTLYKKGNFSNYNAEITTVDGNRKRVQVNASIIYNAAGKPIGAQGVARDVTKELQISDLLETQKKQLDLVIDNSPIGIILVTTKDQKVILANEAICTLLEYSEAEIQKMDIKDYTHPDDRKETKIAIEQMKNGSRDKFAVEKRYLTKSGKTIWARTTVSAIKDSRNIIAYQLATIEDVTSEKLAKEKLIQSENRLSSLVLNLQTGILLEDERGKVVLANKMFCDLFAIDVKPEALIGMDCSEAAKAACNLFKDSTGFIDGIIKLLEQKKPFLKEELELADGSFYERNYTPIYHEGKYQGRLWTYEDITSKKNFEKNLQQQKEKYSNVIANMNLGWVETDMEGRILNANQSFCHITGYTENELLGKDGADLIMIEPTKYGIKDYRNKDFKGVFESHEIQIVTKSGEKKCLLASGTRIFDVNGKINGTIGIHLDITEQKRLVNQKEQLLKSLAEQNEHLNEYAHIVSHDLKSPLRNISALVSWTKEEFLEKLGEKSVQNLDLIQAKIEKMDHLIVNILKYSSIDRDKTIWERINLKDLLSEVLDMIFVPDHIQITMDHNLPTIKGDGTKIQQLFQNLLSNAVNYIDKPVGQIHIGYQDKGGYHQFLVQDNGMGIKEEDFKKIFKIFKTLGDNQKSTGIGLSIVKKVIELYEGDIWLESEYGIGTSFFFTLKKQE